MKRHWIEFRDSPPDGPMTFWVHRPVDTKDWRCASVFNPPRQAVAPGRGYPVFHVEFDGFTFVFTSFAEMRACIDTLGRKLLPRTTDLVAKVYTWNRTGGGPNAHWLARLPKAVKRWKYREKAVAYLAEALSEFQKTLDARPGTSATVGP